MKRKMPLFRVYYSMIVNGTEYPKDAPFSAVSTDDAEKQLEAKLKVYGVTDYKIKETLKES